MRGTVAAVLFVALLVSGLRPRLLRLLVPPHELSRAEGPVSGIDRAPLRLRQDPTPPDLLQFLERVRAETSASDSIAVAIAPPYDDFAYSFWRASYVLAGRRVVRPDAKEEIDVLAYWGMPVEDSRFEPVWSEGRGTMARRR